MTTADDTLRERLLADYEKLPRLEQEIIQLLSVIYEDTNRTNLFNCLRKADIRSADDKAVAPKALAPILDHLIGLDLVEKTDGNRYRCHPLLVEEATRRALRAGRLPGLAAALRDVLPISNYWRHYGYQNYLQGLREIRIHLYTGEFQKAYEAIEACARRFPQEFYKNHPLVLIANNPFDPDWMATLPHQILGDVITIIIGQALFRFEPALQAKDFAEARYREAPDACPPGFRYLLAQERLCQGRIQEARRLVEGQDNPAAEAMQGWADLLEGDAAKAIQRYESALGLLKKVTRKRKIFFESLAGVFFILALLKTGDQQRLLQALDYLAVVEKMPGHAFAAALQELQILIQVQTGQIRPPSLPPDLAYLNVDRLKNPNGFFILLCQYWQHPEQGSLFVKALQGVQQAAEHGGYDWFAMEASALLGRLGDDAHARRAEAFHQAQGILQIADLVSPKAAWEYALSALLELGNEPRKAVSAVPASEFRLVWWLSGVNVDQLGIEPREQKLNAKGEWTKGRPVALKRLVQDAGEMDYLTAQDRQICACIHQYQDYGYYASSHCEFDTNQALLAMVGHPLVFWSDSQTRVEVVKGEPELAILQKRNRLILQLTPDINSDAAVQLVRETPTRLKVVQVAPEHRRIAELLGAGLEIPTAAKDQVKNAIAALSRLVTVQSDIGADAEVLESVPTDSRPRLHLLPFGEGLKLSLLVRPFGDRGPYYQPGAGGQTLIAEIDGKRLQTRRDPSEEIKRAADAVAALPTLARLGKANWDWALDDPEQCLDVLLELQELSDKVVVEWPEGQTFRVGRPATLENFQLAIRRDRDWFGASGDLRLDDGQVLDLRRLLELMAQTPGRFLPLGEGRFLALTQEFRRRLDELRRFSDATAQGVRFHPLAALAIQDLTEEAGSLKVDAHWKNHLKRLREAEALQPEPPSTLQADLRDYQIEGFRWLARLAHWGVGACLADDMGLGKTIQSLALILDRAQGGPSLVVAPTSVCMNWLDEARRFAPTLNPLLFGGGDRQQVLDNLGPFDLLVCSYGLLQQETEKLAAVEWRSIVLDEAQAIKNIQTKRSQAAMALKGVFKMITTGTPIENHLGELWNLFRFINPGLLGSLERFNQRFANPIERDRDTQARAQLKKLIQPFILRRTKSQVLEELPARTEITLHVELSAEEASLYEALRRQALERLAETEVGGGQGQIRILAEIMKLRRACCHPRLVLPEAGFDGAKLETFLAVLEELLENRHKALVFSQFVDHLSILREVLDQRGVRYQYLDGSTPAAERKKRVDAFQAGEGDVFLISLKAGGLGLNLTAADYVIHMDPWWNPAVEDQAADRAHRIGQQRPVTIYRLVAKGTIEDKIVDLHQHKRDLADSLLEGADAGGRLSADELLQLLREA